MKKGRRPLFVPSEEGKGMERRLFEMGLLQEPRWKCWKNISYKVRFWSGE